MFLIIFIFFVITIYFWYQVKYRHRNLLLAKLPAYERTFIFHHTLLLFGKSPREIFDVALEMKNEFGSVFAFTLNPFDDGTVIVSDPKIAEVIMKSQKLLDKGLNYDPIRRWLGEGLLLSIDEKWHHRRKILTPAFHFQILEKFVEIMNDHGKVLVSKLAEFDGKVVDVFPLVNLYTLDVICESAMGCKMNAQHEESEYVDAVKEIVDIIFRRYFHPILRYNFPYKFSGMRQRELRNLKILHKFTDNVIQERKAELMKENSTKNAEETLGVKKKMALLDLLLQSKVDGQLLSDTDIREEVDTFMFEGHDTTTSGIAFCLYNLAKNSEVQEKVFEEVQSCDDDDLNLNALNNLHYLELVIKESLRLYPSVPYFSRKLNQDVHANGFTFPKNCTLHISAYLMGRDAEIFPDPLEFKPERFAAETTVEKLNPFAYVPFSAGPRNCIGQKFAMYELKSAISKIVKNFKLSLPENSEELQIYSELVLKSFNGIKIKIKKR